MADELIFEKSIPGTSAIALPECDVPSIDPGDVFGANQVRNSPPPLPEVGECELTRHYMFLSHRLFSVDGNFYPLGSCTMKYNPKINEAAAAMPGLANLHPYQPVDQVQGMMELLFFLRTFLAEIAGLDEVSLQPAAGAHGELASLMVINAYNRDRNESRDKVLVPDSAHGTNPASCSICGRETVRVRSNSHGYVDLDDLRGLVDEQTSALMITNPNTVGLFDPQIGEIAEILHAKGALLYLDGANMNAVMGMTRPGDFGVDIMHYNTHKTFSTPHGGGGPGAGPIACREFLSPYLPTPQVVKLADGSYDWELDRPKSIGKVRSYYGQIGVLVRAFTYIRGLGAEGLRKASERAVISSNYLAARLREFYDLPYEPPFAHEFVISGDRQKNEGVRALDIAKRLIDYGFHPPTMYWPEIVSECIMIEPTESESLATLDRFCEAMIRIASEVSEDPEMLRHAPHTMPVARLDEVAAARNPNLRWTGAEVA
jgi:glycine dehydrogenase subunit 2